MRRPRVRRRSTVRRLLFAVALAAVLASATRPLPMPGATAIGAGGAAGVQIHWSDGRWTGPGERVMPVWISPYRVLRVVRWSDGSISVRLYLKR